VKGLGEKTKKEARTRGFLEAREKGTYSVRLYVVGGRMECASLRTIADLAEEYGKGYLHLTTRQGVEIPGVKEESLAGIEKELEKAGLDVGNKAGGSGGKVRTVVACPGIDCRHGLIDTQSLARGLAERATSISLPGKFKVSVAGCPNGCTKPIDNDFGVQGYCHKTFDKDLCTLCGACVEVCRSPGTLEIEDDVLTYRSDTCIGCGKCAAVCPTEAFQELGSGYVVYLGGNVGRFPRRANKHPRILDSEQEVYGLFSAVLNWYIEHGEKGERFGRTVNRVGWKNLVACLQDSLPPASSMIDHQSVGPMCP